jgi:hypothetical protein
MSKPWCRPSGVLSVWHAKDFGVVLRRRSGWWASSDTRWERVGVEPNADLAQPTLGPFTTQREAEIAYEAAVGAR